MRLPRMISFKILFSTTPSATGDRRRRAGRRGRPPKSEKVSLLSAIPNEARVKPLFSLAASRVWHHLT